MLLMVIHFLGVLARLYEEGTEDGGEHRDDKLDDALPPFHVFQ